MNSLADILDWFDVTYMNKPLGHILDITTKWIAYTNQTEHDVKFEVIFIDNDGTYRVIEDNAKEFKFIKKESKMV